MLREAAVLVIFSTLRASCREARRPSGVDHFHGYSRHQVAVWIDSKTVGLRHRIFQFFVPWTLQVTQNKEAWWVSNDTCSTLEARRNRVVLSNANRPLFVRRFHVTAIAACNGTDGIER